MAERTYQCRDCKEVYTDTRGDHCPECGGANVIHVEEADHAD